MKANRFFKRFTLWEYWPSYMFYLPNLPYALYLAIKLKNFSFYTAVNPLIKNSGNGTESKFETLKIIPSAFQPKSVFIDQVRDLDSVLKMLHQNGIDYPIIAKPDIGFRGILVEKIYSDIQLKAYLTQYKIATILQEFIDLPNECGIFYYRFPNEEKGHISSITLKSFLKVTGNGLDTLKNLVTADNRAKKYITNIKRTHATRWGQVPFNNEIVHLSAIGNHARGTQFINGNHLINENLVNVFDRISKQMEGLYYGRFDIKFNTFEELQNGKNYCILEINGTIAEPTHIYDTRKTTYFGALKTIRQHWKIMSEIARKNLENGVSTSPFRKLWLEVYHLKTHTKHMLKLTKNLNST